MGKKNRLQQGHHLVGWSGKSSVEPAWENEPFQPMTSTSGALGLDFVTRKILMTLSMSQDSTKSKASHFGLQMFDPSPKSARQHIFVGMLVQIYQHVEKCNVDLNTWCHWITNILTWHYLSLWENRLLPQKKKSTPKKMMVDHHFPH